MTEAPHLSFLALDGIRLGRTPAAAERDHLASCSSCAGYLESAHQAAPLPVPDWLPPAAIKTPVRPHRTRAPGRLWPWLLPLAPVAAAVLLVLLPRPQTPPSDAPVAPNGLRMKGTDAPGLRVFVKRGARVFPWDGQTVVFPDDRLRLEVRRAIYRFVSVAALPPSGNAPVVLYQGPLEGGQGLLPVSFRVDDRGSEEVLSIILGRDPVPARRHVQAGSADGEAHTWRQILVLKKQSAARQVDHGVGQQVGDGVSHELLEGLRLE